MSNNGQMIRSLQGVRFSAFLGVFLSHVGIWEWGPWGVSIFLVLSGFLMTYSYQDRELPQTARERLIFAYQKIRKLYPLHILTMIAAIIVQCGQNMVFYSPSRSVIDAGIVFLHLLMIQPWIPRSGVYFSFNGVSWFLGVVVLCYFAFPKIIARIKLLRTVKDTLKWMIIVYAIQIAIGFASLYISVPTAVSKDFPKWVTYVCPMFRLGDFIVGCLLGWLFLNHKENSENTSGNSTKAIMWTFCEIAVIGISLVIPCEYLAGRGYGWMAYSIAYLPVSALIVIVFAQTRGYLSSLFASDLLVKAGGLTAYAFLIHFQVVMDWLMFTNTNKWVSVIVCLIITLILSYLCRTFNSAIIIRKSLPCGKQ